MQAVIDKLLKLQTTLKTPDKFDTDDFFVNYAIKNIIQHHKYMPGADLVAYAHKQIQEAWCSSDSTLYYMEYSWGYLKVHEYLIA